MRFTSTKRTCPVCRRIVRPTLGDRPMVASHADKVGRFCPMSWERFELTEPYLPPVSTWARRAA